jgi:hypothetical protein
MLDPTKHNYYKKVLDLYRRGKIPAGCLGLVDIYHDDWCGIYRGHYCNCDPDVELRPLPGGDGAGQGRA